MLRLFKSITDLFSGDQVQLAEPDGGYTLDEAVDRVIEGIDTKLRLVPNYRKKLLHEVAASLEYIDGLIDQIPGPLNVSRKTFISDPEVRAYFSTPDTLQNIFSCGNEIKNYFDQQGSCSTDECCALLCAEKQERKISGSILEGNIIKRDVIQTAVSFTDYKVLSPAESNIEVRSGIKKCIFNGLVTYALQHIANFKIERSDLVHRRRILHAQLRSRQKSTNGLSAMLVEAHFGAEQGADIATELELAESQLKSMTGDNDVLSFYLEEIRKVLAKPEDFIRLNQACFRLNDMGIKLEGDAAQSVNEVCFSELEITNVMKRVVAIIRYNRNEINCRN